jgi:hypothetical protein
MYNRLVVVRIIKGRKRRKEGRKGRKERINKMGSKER